MEKCQTCDDRATQWDYDQRMAFCDRHVQQADVTVPLDEAKSCLCHEEGDRCPVHRER